MEKSYELGIMSYELYKLKIIIIRARHHPDKRAN